jgi:class 3 adenylate cyclase
MAIGAPEPRYVGAGDIELAYAVLGAGDRTVVRVTGLGPSLDDAAYFRASWRFIERLAGLARVVLFDRRGQGLSSRTFGFGTAEDRMDDIGTVMDAAGVDRAVLLGDHDAACLALLFAAAYPERVTGLVLVDGSAPRVRWAEDYPIGLPSDLLDDFIEWVGQNWGSGRVLAANFGGSVDGRDARAERALCTPLMAREHHRLGIDMDVRTALPAVHAPTLIAYSVDGLAPIAFGHFLAEHLADASLLEAAAEIVPGEDPIDRLGDRIEEFVTGERPRPIVDVDRVLATVLFVDVVGSTEHLVRVGDRRWRELLGQFRTAVRAELEYYRGCEVDTAGDGVLATFDGSTRAVRCAIAIGRAAGGLDLDVRAGVHTGEVELLGDGIAGIAVHVGARVCSNSGAGEVLVTSTLRDLVAGSGLEFEARGAHELKGVPGSVELFAVVH